MRISLKGHSFEYKGENFICPNYAAYSVEDFYAKPSWEKKNAEHNIKTRMRDFNGEDYGISGGNKFTYSAFWYFSDEDGNRFEVYETHANSYLRGPKTKEIKDAIEARKAEIKAAEEEAKRRAEKRAKEEKEFQEAMREYAKKLEAYIRELLEETECIYSEDTYKDYHNLIAREVEEFIDGKICKCEYKNFTGYMSQDTVKYLYTM